MARNGLLYKHYGSGDIGTFTVFNRGNYYDSIMINTAATGSVTVYEGASTVGSPIIAVLDTSTVHNKSPEIAASAITIVKVGTADITIAYDGVPS